MKGKRKILVCTLCLLLLTTPMRSAGANAAIPIIEVIRFAVKKVIKAIDLRIQRLQNKTIWLQNAQKKIENVLSKLKLEEISNWTQKQRDLYRDYYDELMKVKSSISYYRLIKEVYQKQLRLVKEYEKAWSLFQKDRHFSASELDYMQSVYSGILDESLKNLDQLFLIVDSFTTQMSDAKRLEIINAAADQLDKNYDALSQFNRENVMLSLQRAKSKHEVDVIRKLYSILN
ncbi:conjugal transfer protein TraI [Flavobacterium sp. MAHUQ-51]|uniref:conjugal transfer protein TraI n=1 Tax=Flavobacterium sp. GCM10022190 TaxID=3252639 RepID=UPI00360E6E38